MKNKFITTVVATALALTMTFSLANGMDVKAAEITEDSLVAAEDTNVGNESVDIQQQEPVRNFRNWKQPKIMTYRNRQKVLQ